MRARRRRPHAWHTLLTHERGGYYQDYVERPLDHVTRVLASGFSYQGESSVHRGGRARGERSDKLSPLAFVNFLQNHDQIGNRPLGDRLSTLVDPAPLTAALAITLLAPMPPLLSWRGMGLDTTVSVLLRFRW